MSFLKYKYFQIKNDDSCSEQEIINFIKENQIMVFGPYSCVCYDMDQEIKKIIKEGKKILIIRGEISDDMLIALKKYKNDNVLLQSLTECREYTERHWSGEWFKSKVHYHIGFKILD